MSVQLTLFVDLCHLFTLPCWPDKVSSTTPPAHIVLFAANTVPELVGLTDKNTLEEGSDEQVTGLLELTIAL
jgi:hypothetical protein